MPSNTYAGSTVNFIKPYKDTSYTIVFGTYLMGQQLGIGGSGGQWVFDKYTSYFRAGSYFWTYGFDWIATGYIN